MAGRLQGKAGLITRSTSVMDGGLMRNQGQGV
jgi:hypothetical protein